MKLNRAIYKLSGLSGVVVVGAALLFLLLNTRRIEVGECVRELGHWEIEKVDYITSNGAVETVWIDDTGHSIYNAYDDTSKLIKIQCGK